ncbi:uncharacterized protein LOC105803705 isoform X1 [Gossypium raimondii]|uniref:uncharacterized protein LOC105803705 isoform X1 n=1 Tax=Gossypium raimondii TaxID=29730 RepID=UPI00227C6CE4|nr:uncharacterized protein LOC105803705 isoform X1 [Gossypium raimondii]
MEWNHPDISLEEMMKLIEGNDKKKESGDDKFDKPISETRVSREECGSNGRNLNKKRSYAQFHLELGQSNFLLLACQSTKRSGTFQPKISPWHKRSVKWKQIPKDFKILYTVNSHVEQVELRGNTCEYQSSHDTMLAEFQRISGAPQDNNVMLWNAVIFGLDDTPWDGGNKVNNIDGYYFDYLWCKDYKYIKVIFSDCRETSASQPRVHEDWITRNVADVVCIVFFITKIYLIKKMHCIFYYLAMCIVIGKFN